MREAKIAECEGTAADTITTPSCELAFEAAPSQSADDWLTSCPAGCEFKLEDDFVPLICLMVGVMVLVLVHLVAFLVSTSDRYVTKSRKDTVVKQWMSLQQGSSSMHSAAVAKAEDNAEHAARALLAKTHLRYRLFPDHQSAAANHLKKSLQKSAAGSFVRALEKKAVYITEDEAFGPSNVQQSGFSTDGKQWYGAYVCESEMTGVISGEHVVKFNIKKDGRLGGHIDLLGKRHIEIYVPCVRIFTLTVRRAWLAWLGHPAL
jgi:hypothetical protein